jgi:Double-GTPase 1
MSTIAVVGTEGSGKTVLLTTLAKRLSDGTGGILITPQNRATNKFVEEVWATLTSKEWPPSTPPGVLIQLHWKITAPGGFSANLSVNDCAGQDLRYLFAEEGVKEASVTEKIQTLVKAVREADIVLFVVNLRGFVAENDPGRLTDNQWFLQYAMEFVKQSGAHKRFCLVFTQADQYPMYLKQHGSWREVARSRLPQVFGAYLSQDRVEVLGVSTTRRRARGASPGPALPRRESIRSASG